MTTVTMAVEGRHSSSLTLVWFTGVAFTSECTKCRNGSYSSGGTAFCAPCEANMYSTRGAAQCLACKPDEYSGKRQWNWIGHVVMTHWTAGWKIMIHPVPKLYMSFSLHPPPPPTLCIITQHSSKCAFLLLTSYCSWKTMHFLSSSSMLF